MVTLIEYKGGAVEYAGLSTDNKPTENVATGSTFIEVNTGKIYLFDAENATWHEWGA